MRINFNNERILQLLIISVCIIILTVRFSTESTCAQTPCPVDQPPFITHFGTPQKSARRQGTSVTVKYYDRTDNNPTETAEITAVSNSIKDWNNRGCSNVTFGNAQPTGVAWDGSQPPANEMWVVRTTDRSGQLVAVGNFTTGMVAARLYMHSDYNLRTRDHFMRVDNLAKHETSHSFGIGNCTAFPNNPIAVVCSNSFTTIPGGVTLLHSVMKQG